MLVSKEEWLYQQNCLLLEKIYGHPQGDHISYNIGEKIRITLKKKLLISGTCVSSD